MPMSGVGVQKPARAFQLPQYLRQPVVSTLRWTLLKDMLKLRTALVTVTDTTERKKAANV